MKLLFTLVLIMTNLMSWTFTKEDFDSLNEDQKEVLRMAKAIGHKYDLGNVLVQIAVVETRLGKISDRSSKQFCGPMQISIKYAKVSCDALNDNLYLSMEYAAREILKWYDIHKSMSKAIMFYNTGYIKTDYGAVYLARANLVGKVLEEVDL